MQLRLLAAMAVLLSASAAFAEPVAYRPEGIKSSELKTSTETKRYQFLFGVEATQVTLTNGNLNGLGARIGLEYALSNRFSVLPSLAMVMGAFTTSGYLYTGLNAALRFSIFGSMITRQTQIHHDGMLIVSQAQDRQNRLALTVGLEQLILSGSTSAYLAVGPGGGLGYTLHLFGGWMEISARAAFMTGNSRPVSAYFLNLSFIPEF